MIGQDVIVLAVVGLFLLAALVAVVRHGDGNDHEPPTLNTRGEE